MPKVHVLDEHTANRIAAGEVIERPSAVVKELLENSLDAGAQRVLIEVEEGGRRFIQVTDDGCGMSQEDALLALQRHATSKISTAEDLERIVTLGFRGEALPSIAAVSRMELITCELQAQTGTRLLVEAGEVKSVSEVGAPPGTRVVVRDLFFNTPARLKFLKSVPTELSHLVDVAGKLAIAHFGVSIRLVHNGREIFSTPGSEEVRQAIGAVWGRERAQGLLPFSLETGRLKVWGYAVPPDQTRPNRSGQILIVNRRPIVSRLLSHAVEEAYRTLLPEGRFPGVILFLEVDPEYVDVNVHPAKSEVRFTGEGEIHAWVVRAVRQALLNAGALPRVTEIGVPNLQPPPVGSPSFTPSSASRSKTQQFYPEALEARRRELFPDLRLGIAVEVVPPEKAEERPVDHPPSPSYPWRLIGQVMDTFLIGESPEGLVIIDQHVAHERILYEKLHRELKAKKVESQLLLLPTVVTLEPKSASALENALEALAQMGFEVAPFGGRTFLVRAVPAVFSTSNPERLIRELAEDLAETEGLGSTPSEEQLDHIVATTACHAAVKANQPLAPAEIRHLVQELLRCEDPYHCPHGRPILLQIPLQEILKRFKRV